MARTRRLTPAQLAPGPWPETPSPDPIGEVGRQITVRLREAIGTQSLRAVASQTRLNHATLVKILDGSTWPDAETLAKLEHGLGVDIWPGRQTGN
jgi:lambda repressor-like predicted transcriptional regulator